MINDVFVLNGTQDLLDIKPDNNMLSIASPCKTLFHLPISPPASNEIFTTLQTKYHNAISKLISKRNRMKKCSSVRNRQSIDITKMLNDTLTIATTPLKMKQIDQEKLLLSVSKSKLKSMGHRSSKLPIKNNLSSNHTSKNINEIFASHFNSNNHIMNLTQATPAVKIQKSKISLLDRNDDDSIANNQNMNNSTNFISSAIIDKRAISKNSHTFSSIEISDNTQGSNSIMKPTNSSAMKVSVATSTLLSPKLIQQFDSSKKKLPINESIDCFSPAKFQLQPKSVPNTPVQLLLLSPVSVMNTTPRTIQLMRINSMEGLNELKNSAPGTPVNLTSEKMKALISSMRKTDKFKQTTPSSKQFMSNSPKKNNFNNTTPIIIQSFDHEFDTFEFSSTTVPLTSNPIQSLDHRFDFGFGFSNTTVPFTINPMSLSPKPTRSSLSNTLRTSIVKDSFKKYIECIDNNSSSININTNLHISTTFDEEVSSQTKHLTYADESPSIKSACTGFNCLTEEDPCSPMDVIIDHSNVDQSIIDHSNVDKSIDHIDEVQDICFRDDMIPPKLLFSSEISEESPNNNSPVPMQIVDDNIMITPSLEEIQSHFDNQYKNEDDYIPFPDINDSLTEESPLMVKKQLSKTPTPHSKILNSGSAKRIIHSSNNNINTPDKSMTSIDIAMHKSSLSKGPRRFMKSTPMKAATDHISKDHIHSHNYSDSSIERVEPSCLKSPCIKSVSVANLIKKFQSNTEKPQSEVINKIASSIKNKSSTIEEKSHANNTTTSEKPTLISTKTPMNSTKTLSKTAGKSTKSKVRFAGIPSTPPGDTKKPEDGIDCNLEITPLKINIIQKPMNITRTRSSVRLQRRSTISNDESTFTTSFGFEHNTSTSILTSMKEDLNVTLLTNVPNSEITTPLVEIKKQPLNSSSKLSQRRQSCSTATTTAATTVHATLLSKSIMNLLNDVQESFLQESTDYPMNNKENNQYSSTTTNGTTKITKMTSSTPNTSVSVVKAKRIEREKHLDELFGSCDELLSMIDNSVVNR